MIKYISKNIYKGTFRDGLKHGTGIEYYDEEQKLYEGDFNMNLRDGNGQMINSKLELYEDTWQAGKFIGKPAENAFSLLRFNEIGEVKSVIYS
jgi:hypothetical protein